MAADSPTPLSVVPKNLTTLFVEEPAQDAAVGARQCAGVGPGPCADLRPLQVYVRIRPASVPGLSLAGAEASDAPEGEDAGDAAPRAAAGRKAKNGDPAAADPCHLASLEPCMWARDAETLCVRPPPGTLAGRSGFGAARAFTFGGVFGGETSQASYYRETLQPLVRELARGARDPGSGACRAASVLAYGMTTAGKTWTVQGSRDDPGLLPRAATELFEELERGKEAADAAATPPLLCVTLAMYEVYNEEVYDLLPEGCEVWKSGAEEEEVRRRPEGAPPARPKPRAPLRVRDDAEGEVHVEGLRRWRAAGPAQAVALLEEGARLRARAATALNASSSRSHCVVELGVWESEGAGGEKADSSAFDPGGRSPRARLCVADLAGSERARRTGHAGARMAESIAINRSLMALGRCLHALHWNQRRGSAAPPLPVPARESKLTRLFGRALHGWGGLVLSVSVSPLSRDCDETLHVLQYAALATGISSAVGVGVGPVKKAAPKKELLGARGGVRKAVAAARLAVARLASGRRRQVKDEHDGKAALPLLHDAEAALPLLHDAEAALPLLHDAPGLSVADDAETLPPPRSPASPGWATPEDAGHGPCLRRERHLRVQLEAAQALCVEVESRVRAEAAAELDAALREMGKRGRRGGDARGKGAREGGSGEAREGGSGEAQGGGSGEAPGEGRGTWAVEREALRECADRVARVCAKMGLAEGEEDRRASSRPPSPSTLPPSLARRLRRLEAAAASHRDSAAQEAANSSAELDLALGQLERARKEGAALRSEAALLRAALCQVEGSGAGVDAILARLGAGRALEAEKGGRTPHAVALSRAQEAIRRESGGEEDGQGDSPAAMLPTSDPAESTSPRRPAATLPPSHPAPPVPAPSGGAPLTPQAQVAPASAAELQAPQSPYFLLSAPRSRGRAGNGGKEVSRSRLARVGGADRREPAACAQEVLAFADHVLSRKQTDEPLVLPKKVPAKRRARAAKKSRGVGKQPPVAEEQAPASEKQPPAPEKQPPAPEKQPLDAGQGGKENSTPNAGGKTRRPKRRLERRGAEEVAESLTQPPAKVPTRVPTRAGARGRPKE